MRRNTVFTFTCILKMKLIHRLHLDICRDLEDNTAALSVSASFYRPFLDGTYKQMVAQLIEAGCFDNLIQYAIELLVTKGNLVKQFFFTYRCLWSSSINIYFKGCTTETIRLEDKLNMSPLWSPL